MKVERVIQRGVEDKVLAPVAIGRPIRHPRKPMVIRRPRGGKGRKCGLHGVAVPPHRCDVRQRRIGRTGDIGQAELPRKLCAVLGETWAKACCVYQRESNVRTFWG